MSDIEELPIPDVVRSASRKAEMARIWLSDGKQIVTLSDRLWDDPAAWGIMLVDLAKHVANAYEAKGFENGVALDRIKKGMEAEWAHATSPVKKL